MKIVILMGSPNKKGSTSILVDSFKKGAEESGHNVEVIDVCHAAIRPCTGCIACGYEHKYDERIRESAYFYVQNPLVAATGQQRGLVFFYKSPRITECFFEFLKYIADFVNRG